MALIPKGPRDGGCGTGGIVVEDREIEVMKILLIILKIVLQYFDPNLRCREK
jgi:hypothetical protein